MDIDEEILREKFANCFGSIGYRQKRKWFYVKSGQGPFLRGVRIDLSRRPGYTSLNPVLTVYDNIAGKFIWEGLAASSSGAYKRPKSAKFSDSFLLLVPLDQVLQEHGIERDVMDYTSLSESDLSRVAELVCKDFLIVENEFFEEKESPEQLIDFIETHGHLTLALYQVILIALYRMYTGSSRLKKRVAEFEKSELAPVTRSFIAHTIADIKEGRE